MKKKDEFIVGISMPASAVSELRGKQSVRATFKLPRITINTISIVSRQLGIKQKSLFDHLVEDVHTLRQIAEDARKTAAEQHTRIQKTYVVSRRTLEMLEEMSRDYNAPRDILVEGSVRRLLPVIAREREKHEKRKALLKEMKAHFNQGKALLEKSFSLLGEGDPVTDRFTAVMSGYETGIRHMDHFMGQCAVIEDFDPEDRA